MALLIGLDLGTTKLAALALEASSGEEVASVAAPNGARRDALVQGLARAELDVAALQAQALALLRELVAALPEGSEVIALGVTGQQHGVALLSADGAPLPPAITWQDQRALEQATPTTTYLDQLVAQAGGPARFHGMGCQPAPGYLGATLFWLARHGALPPNARAGFVPDVAVAALIGGAPATDPTLAGSSALYVVESSRWDVGLCAVLGLGGVRLPEVKPTGSIAGRLSAAAARLTGLAPGLPVAVGLGDNQASFLGSVTAPHESVLVNIGTGGQVSALVDRFARLPTVDTRAFPGGGYLLVGAGSSGGATLGYLHDMIRAIGREVFGVERNEVYGALLALTAQAPPGADGVRCVPHLAGTRADPAVTASWSGLTAANLTLGNLTRALIEGIAADAHAFWQLMAPVAGPRRTLVGAGNGLTRNAVLCEALESAFELPLTLTRRTEAAAFGAALCAGVAVGAHASFEAAMRGVASPTSSRLVTRRGAP
jgi:sugar (pentulose or hexulose) kinase